MNRKEIAEALRKLGVKNGDVVLLHSALSAIGHVEGGAEAVVDAFLDAVGDDGTLVVPAFGNLGIITTTVKSRAEAKISDHPNARVAAIGKNAEAICAEHWEAETAHGEGTPYLKIAKLGGKICLMGVDQDRNTTLHSVEALLRLPYLKTITSKRTDADGNEETKDFPFFPGPHRDFIGLDKYLRHSGKMTIGKVGNAVTSLIKSEDLIEVCAELGRKDPAFCLCDNPECADCVGQRAKIAAARFAQENFELAASAILAGKYVPEIAENLKRAGICKLDLDYLEGKPIQTLSPAKIAAVAAGFADEGITVRSLRSSSVDSDVSPLIDIAAENGIPCACLPINSEMKSQIRMAEEKGIKLEFYNTIESSDLVCSILLALKEKGVSANFAFNAANFAACGEKPFLTSYRKKLKRFISRIDIEDMTFSGEVRELAMGNAEIKEVVSISRCSSFPGCLTLGARNRFIGSLNDTAKRFAWLLENM